ncbi:hypothetical protein GC170_15400 [bacterium]|nr:hypothetical protein [bacterium]
MTTRYRKQFEGFRSGHRTLAILTAGFVLGAAAVGIIRGSRPVFAMPSPGADRSTLMSCIVTSEYNDARKVQIPVEGLVYLDYRSGKLIGTMPEMRQIGLQKRILSNFTERDLVEDFGIEPGQTPNFLLQAISTGALSDSGQLIVVLDTQTRQARIYKLSFEQRGVEFRPQFVMLEKKTFDTKTNVDILKSIPGAEADQAGLPQLPN